MHHCPKCGKELGLSDQRGVADHPKAARLKSLTMPVTWAWVCILVVMFVVISLQDAGARGLPERGIGWMIAFAPFIPGFLIHVASWCFRRMRIWHCSSCGHRSEQELK